MPDESVCGFLLLGGSTHASGERDVTLQFGRNFSYQFHPWYRQKTCDRDRKFSAARDDGLGDLIDLLLRLAPELDLLAKAKTLEHFCQVLSRFRVRRPADRRRIEQRTFEHGD